MSLIIKDRVLETCTSPGSGTVTLLGAVTGYQTFNSAVGTTNTCYYGIADQNGNNWEVGIGTFTAPASLARTTILASSNGGGVVNFSTGSQNVFLTYPASKAVTTDTLAYPPAIGSTTPNTGDFTTLTASADSEFTSTGALLISKGTTGEQPVSPVVGMVRYNTTNHQFEGYSGSPPSWSSVGSTDVVNDTTTVTETYPVVVKQTTGNTTTVFTSDPEYTYIPDSGELRANIFASQDHQIGNSGTASNNFTWYQPSTPDGTVRLGQGNAEATTSDLILVESTGVTLYDDTTLDNVEANIVNINDVLNLPTWTNGTRPGAPVAAMTGYNTSIGQAETYNGTVWVASGGLVQQSVKTSGFTAAVGNSYPVDTSGGPVIVLLPASPVAGQQVNVFDYAGTAATNNITIDPNGKKINGLVTPIILLVPRISTTIVYVDSTQGWVSLFGGGESFATQYYQIDLLVVAGGGGGGGLSTQGGGGGGAGGYRAPSPVVLSTEAYSITVGAGGAAGSAGSSGSSSSFSTTSSLVTPYTYTSIGGGGGGAYQGGGGSGGSGGGCGRDGTSGGSGTSGQGNVGGSAPGGSCKSGGGGGGAAQAGYNSGADCTPRSGTGGAGGAGSQWYNGSYYAGGGGGAWESAGVGAPGGIGGGGTGGGSSTPSATAGGIYTGGGGGGGQYVSLAANGGSGIVILRYAGTQRGVGGTVTSSGGYTYHTFTSSGTYTA